MTRTLSDPVTQDSIKRFILEARESARGREQQRFGFAAMLTVFPVILAVSEAVNGRQSNKELIIAFVHQMIDKTSWLLAPRSNLSDDDIGTKLAEVRDSLAHQLSLTPEILLDNTNEEAEEISEIYRDKYIISTKEFIDAAEGTVCRVSKTHPDVPWDRSQKVPRDTAHRLEVSALTSYSLTGASGVSNAVPRWQDEEHPERE